MLIIITSTSSLLNFTAKHRPIYVSDYFLYEKELIMSNLCLRLDSCREYSNYTCI